MRQVQVQLAALMASLVTLGIFRCVENNLLMKGSELDNLVIAVVRSSLEVL